MISIPEIVARQSQWVVEWHQSPPENNQQGFWFDVCQQHQYNFLLWHEEDSARCPAASNETIANVKRAIDRYNQLRNDWIERLDDQIFTMISHAAAKPATNQRLATETPGSVIDRLSIMALRLFHLDEQLSRDNVTNEHRKQVQNKIDRCREQQRDLMLAAQALIHDIFTGQVKHRIYRQHKMYNDPNLNPYLYQQREQSTVSLKLDDEGCEGVRRRAA